MRCALRWFVLLAAVSALLAGIALGQAVFGGILGIAVINPNIDSLQEFKVTTGNYDAQLVPSPAL